MYRLPDQMQSKVGCRVPRRAGLSRSCAVLHGRRRAATVTRMPAVLAFLMCRCLGACVHLKDVTRLNPFKHAALCVHAVQVEEMYARDVARMIPGEAVKMDSEYKSFLAELGGGPPPEEGGGMRGGCPGGQGGGGAVSHVYMFGRAGRRAAAGGGRHVRSMPAGGRGAWKRDQPTDEA